MQPVSVLSTRPSSKSLTSWPTYNVNASKRLKSVFGPRSLLPQHVVLTLAVLGVQHAGEVVGEAIQAMPHRLDPLAQCVLMLMEAAGATSDQLVRLGAAAEVAMLLRVGTVHAKSDLVMLDGILNVLPETVLAIVGVALTVLLVMVDVMVSVLLATVGVILNALPEMVAVTLLVGTTRGRDEMVAVKADGMVRHGGKRVVLGDVSGDNICMSNVLSADR
jgi:hypothetical protein